MWPSSQPEHHLPLVEATRVQGYLAPKSLAPWSPSTPDRGPREPHHRACDPSPLGVSCGAGQGLDHVLSQLPQRNPLSAVHLCTTEALRLVFAENHDKVIPLVSDQVVDDAMKAIVELRGRGYAPEHTYVMDETGLWSNVMQPHTYSPVGRYALTAFPKTPIFVHIFPKMGNYPIFVFTSLSRPQLLSPSILYPVLTLSSGNAVVEELGDRFRDTMIAVVRGDGCKLPPFFIKGQYGNARKDSDRRPAPGAKPVRGVNNANIVQWIVEFMEHIREPSILLWDRLAVHKSKASIEEIESYVFEDGSPAVEVMLLPPQTAFLLSPLDMGGFAEFKKYYYAFDRSTYELKISAANRAWSMISAENIRSYFLHCGLSEKRRLRDVKRQFLKEVRGSLVEEHPKVWELYDSWRNGTISVEGVSSATRLSLEQPSQLRTGSLDGSRWTQYGS